MTTRDVTYDGNKKGISMTECPCGYELDPQEQLENHLLNDHVPSDFGLSPLRSGQVSFAKYDDDTEEVMPDGGT